MVEPEPLKAFFGDHRTKLKAIKRIYDPIDMFVVTEGIIETGFVQENGFDTLIETQLGKLQATVFPMGSLHYQINPTCSEAVFVAALNSEDPGRSDMATTYWMLPSEVVDASFGFPSTIGGGNIDQWRSRLPVNLAAGVDSCLRACNLTSEEY